MLNHADDLSYPRCGQCHEDLVRCPFCRHYEEGACAHPRARAQYTPDGEAAKQCAAYRSRHETNDPRILHNLPAPLWVLSLLALVVGMLTTAICFVDPSGWYFFGVGKSLKLEMQVPTRVIHHQEFYVTLHITNYFPGRSTPIYLEIPREYLSAATPGMPTPRPREFIQNKDHAIFTYAPLEEGEERAILLPLVQNQLGEAMFHARIYAPRNHLFQEVKMPIVAVAGHSLPEQGRDNDARGEIEGVR